MKNAQESQTSQDIKPDKVSTEQPNNATETAIPDSDSVSSNENRKVSREDIELVQNLIERCLQLYMNRDEVVKTLLSRARIDPGFTTLVWQKLEEENADFFRAYYIRLKLKKQIILFNHLLEHQYNNVRKYPVPPKVPLAPIQNGIHPMPGNFYLLIFTVPIICFCLMTSFSRSAVNNLPMGYPVMQQPPIPPATGQPHINATMVYSHVVNGVPAPANFHPMRMHSGNDMVIDTNMAEVSPIIPPNNGQSTMSEMAISPTSVASSGHFPFIASEIPGMGIDASALDMAFTSDVTSSVGLELPPDNNNGVGRPLAQIPWNFSLSDLTADLSNLEDLGALGNYSGSAFLPSDSDILLDSPEPDDLVEEFFVDSDSVPEQCPPSDEEKS